MLQQVSMANDLPLHVNIFLMHIFCTDESHFYVVQSHITYSKFDNGFRETYTYSDDSTPLLITWRFV